jgi:hypothetical protein
MRLMAGVEVGGRWEGQGSNSVPGGIVDGIILAVLVRYFASFTQRKPVWFALLSVGFLSRADGR